jgi:hypothetical protein
MAEKPPAPSIVETDTPPPRKRPIPKIVRFYENEMYTQTPPKYKPVTAIHYTYRKFIQGHDDESYDDPTKAPYDRRPTITGSQYVLDTQTGNITLQTRYLMDDNRINAKKGRLVDVPQSTLGFKTYHLAELNLAQQKKGRPEFSTYKVLQREIIENLQNNPAVKYILDDPTIQMQLKDTQALAYEVAFIHHTNLNREPTVTDHRRKIRYEDASHLTAAEAWLSTAYVSKPTVTDHRIETTYYGSRAPAAGAGLYTADVLKPTVTDHRRKPTVTDHRRKTTVTDHRRKPTVTDHRRKPTVTDHRRKTTYEEASHAPAAGAGSPTADVSQPPYFMGNTRKRPRPRESDRRGSIGL